MNENIKSIAYGNDVFIAAAGDRILKSTDGENWELSRMTSGTSANSLTRVVFGGNKFLVCGECYFFITSDNGTTWTEFGMMPSPFPYAAYGDEKFYLACSGGSWYRSSGGAQTTSIKWRSRPTPTAGFIPRRSPLCNGTMPPCGGRCPIC